MIIFVKYAVDEKILYTLFGNKKWMNKLANRFGKSGKVEKKVKQLLSEEDLNLKKIENILSNKKNK